MKGTRDTKRSGAPSPPGPERVDRRLHQRRQVLAAQPAHRRRRAGRGRALRDPRPDHPAHDHRRRPGLHDVATPSGSCGTCRTSWSRRSARRWRRSPTPTWSLHVVDGSHPDPEGQIAAVREVFAEIGADKVPELIVINKADAADPMVVARLRQREPHSVVVSAQDRRGHRRGAGRRSRASCPGRGSSSRRCCPTSAATWSTGSTSSGEIASLEHTGDGTLVARPRPRGPRRRAGGVRRLRSGAAGFPASAGEPALLGQRKPH